MRGRFFEPEEYDLRQPHMTTALSGSATQFEVQLEYAGAPRYFEATYTPHAKDEHILGVFIMYQDVTERRIAEMQLKEANETLEERVVFAYRGAQPGKTSSS